MSIAKARVVRLAKRMFGNRAIVEEHKNALDADGRLAEIEKGKQRRAKRAALEPIARTEFQIRQRVLTAARNVVANQTSVTSIEALDAALVSYKVVEEAVAERLRLFREGRNNTIRRRRCEVSEYDNAGGLPISIQVAVGDTWEEVLDRLNQLAGKKGGS